MSNKLRAKNFYIFLGGKALGASTSVSLTVTTNMINVASPTSQYERSLPGRVSWSASAQKMIEAEPGAMSELLVSQINRTPIQVAFFEVNPDRESVVPKSQLLMGTGYITEIQAQGDINGAATCSISIKGSGGLTQGAWLNAQALPAQPEQRPEIPDELDNV